MATIVKMPFYAMRNVFKQGVKIIKIATRFGTLKS